MIYLRNFVRLLALLCVVFGIPAAAALLAGRLGWSPPLVGWLTLLLLLVLGWFAARAERSGNALGLFYRKLRRIFFPTNNESPPRRSGGRRKID